METVATNLLFSQVLIGQRIGIGAGRQRVMERGVENRYVRDQRKFRPGDSYTFEIMRIVQRRQIAQLFNPFFHLVIDDHRRTEQVAAVHYPMPDRFYFCAAQLTEHGLKRVVDVRNTLLQSVCKKTILFP